jgi:hypothetical protein
MRNFNIQNRHESKCKRFVGYYKVTGSVFAVGTEPMWIIFDKVFKREYAHCTSLKTMKGVLKGLSNF